MTFFRRSYGIRRALSCSRVGHSGIGPQQARNDFASLTATERATHQLTTANSVVQRPSRINACSRHMN